MIATVTSAPEWIASVSAAVAALTAVAQLAASVYKKSFRERSASAALPA
jgi:hypothetical protein